MLKVQFKTFIFFKILSNGGFWAGFEVNCEKENLKLVDCEITSPT